MKTEEGIKILTVPKLFLWFGRYDSRVVDICFPVEQSLEGFRITFDSTLDPISPHQNAAATGCWQFLFFPAPIVLHSETGSWLDGVQRILDLLDIGEQID